VRSKGRTCSRSCPGALERVPRYRLAFPTGLASWNLFFLETARDHRTGRRHGIHSEDGEARAARVCIALDQGISEGVQKRREENEEGGSSVTSRASYADWIARSPGRDQLLGAPCTIQLQMRSRSA